MFSVCRLLICRGRRAKVHVHLQVPRKHHGGKSQREKVSKTFHQNRADSLAPGDKGSCFKQEKLLALDEEDV